MTGHMPSNGLAKASTRAKQITAIAVAVGTVLTGFLWAEREIAKISSNAAAASVKEVIEQESKTTRSMILGKLEEESAAREAADQDSEKDRDNLRYEIRSMRADEDLYRMRIHRTLDSLVVVLKRTQFQQPFRRR